MGPARPVWLNGALYPAEAARIDPSDRGFTLGDGLFETILVRTGAPRRWGLHFARLRAGAELLGIPLRWSEADLHAAILALLAAYAADRAMLRLTLTRGPGPRGVLPPDEPRPTLLMSAVPASEGLPPPATLVVSRTTCRNERSPLARIKSLNYLDGVLARREAQGRGADDAILLDTQGRVAEATAANLILVVDGQAITPPVAHGALPGIARGRLLAAGAVAERGLGVDALARVMAALLVNALGSRRVASIEGRPLAWTSDSLQACEALLDAD